MSSKYSNYDWLPETKKVLISYTLKGYITIERLTKMIIAKDNEGNEVARSYIMSEKGLQWVKKECRGWHDHNRRKWAVIEKSSINVATK